MKTQYQTTVSATGGRNGHVKSEDGFVDFDVLMPKELGGKGGATNPEQLFAAGYAACFDSALNMVIGKAKVKPEKETTVTATGLITANGGIGGTSTRIIYISSIKNPVIIRSQYNISCCHTIITLSILT